MNRHCENKVYLNDQEDKILGELAKANWSDKSAYIRGLIAKDYQINKDKLSIDDAFFDRHKQGSNKA